MHYYDNNNFAVKRLEVIKNIDRQQIKPHGFRHKNKYH